MDINYEILIAAAIIVNARTENLKVILKIIREIGRIIG
ncbi:hypothetical protein NB710_000121 [Xanthomonas sacchari]|nr:hypothetical protein [Xanthomonas sacchari]